MKVRANRKLRRIVVPALTVLLGILSSIPPCLSGDWPQWRGPSRDGVADGPEWPDALDGLREQWRVPLGKGYPGPIVSGDRVFVVETVDKKTVAARALALGTGAELWRVEWAGTGSVPFFASANGSWVRSTPAYDGSTLFVGDMRELLLALDGATGNERWRVSFPERYGTAAPDFGFASSPLVDGDDVYVQAANSVIKLDKSNGETIWRSLENSGKMTASGAFSSPVLAEIDGDRQLLVLTRSSLNGLSPKDGSVLWSVEIPNFRGMHIMTPVVSGATIFTSPYKQASFMFDVHRVDRGFEVVEKWSNKSTGYMSTPVTVGTHIYMHLGNGRLECLDGETGESRWRSESFGKYWSMAARGDKILGLNSDGTLFLMRANPERFELLDSRSVSEDETWAHIAVADDRVLVRGLREIVAYRFDTVAPEAGKARAQLVPGPSPDRLK